MNLEKNQNQTTVKIIGGPFDGRSYPEDVHKHLPAYYQHIRYDFVNDLALEQYGKEGYEIYKQTIYGDNYEEWKRKTINIFENELILVCSAINRFGANGIPILDFIHGLLWDGWFDVKYLNRDRKLVAKYSVIEYLETKDEFHSTLKAKE